MDNNIITPSGDDRAVDLADSPTITYEGKPYVGNVLTVVGNVESADATVGYRWFRDNNPIPRATANFHTISKVDVGHDISCSVTTSINTDTIVALHNIIKCVVGPRITGTRLVNAPLTVDVGKWVPEIGLTYTYQWYRDGVIMPTQTTNAYTPVTADAGSNFHCEILATFQSYNLVMSTSTVGITTGRPVMVNTPIIQGLGNIGATHTVLPPIVSEPNVTIEYKWFRKAADGTVTDLNISSTTYVITNDDAGCKIYVEMTITNPVNGAELVARTPELPVVDFRLSYTDVPKIEQTYTTFNFTPGVWNPCLYTGCIVNYKYQWALVDDTGTEKTISDVFKLGAFTLIPKPEYVGQTLVMYEFAANDYETFKARSNNTVVQDFTPKNTQPSVITQATNADNRPMINTQLGVWTPCSSGTTPCVNTFAYQLKRVKGEVTTVIADKFDPTSTWFLTKDDRDASLVLEESVTNLYGTTIGKSTPLVVTNYGPINLTKPALSYTLDAAGSKYSFTKTGDTWDTDNPTFAYNWSKTIAGTKDSFSTDAAPILDISTLSFSDPAAATGRQIYFDGTVDGIDMASAQEFGTADWTVEAWISMNSLPVDDTSIATLPIIFSTSGFNSSRYNYPFAICIGYTKLVIIIGNTIIMAATHGIIPKQWYHIAYARDKSNLRMFVNGKVVGSMSYTSAITTGSPKWCFANHHNFFDARVNLYGGYMKSCHVVQGTALYTTDFPVPAEIVAHANTKALIRMNPTTQAIENAKGGSITLIGAPNIVKSASIDIELELTATDTYGSTKVSNTMGINMTPTYITDFTADLVVSSPMNWSRKDNVYTFTGGYCSILFPLPLARQRGRQYLEITVATTGGTFTPYICISDKPTRTGPYIPGKDRTWYPYNENYHNDSNISSYIGMPGATLQTYGLVINFATGSFRRYEVTTNPVIPQVTPNNVDFSAITASARYLAIFSNSSAAANSGQITLNWGQSPFVGRIPSGIEPIGQVFKF